MGVLQMAFIGLIMVDHLPPLLAPLTRIFPVNGYNTLFSNTATKDIPYRISSLNYQAEMVSSLNYTVLLLVAPLIASLVMFVLSKVIKSSQ